jgi:hypothetical protein
MTDDLINEIFDWLQAKYRIDDRDKARRRLREACRWLEDEPPVHPLYEIDGPAPSSEEVRKRYGMPPLKKS